MRKGTFYARIHRNCNEGTCIDKTIFCSVDVLQGVEIAGICVVSAIMKAENPKVAAEQLRECVRSRLLKGGHMINDANDLLYADGEALWFEGKHINNPNTHGTGCTLSSAIASNLAKGFPLAESVQRAKDYISGALTAMLDLGKGSGPMMHNFDLKSCFAEEKESV